MTRKNRTRKLTIEQRIELVKLYHSGDFTMVELGRRYGISQPRVSQIVNNVYNELRVNE
jgi:DNA-directed RNA polymerase specialized sigma subunit